MGACVTNLISFKLGSLGPWDVWLPDLSSFVSLWTHCLSCEGVWPVCWHVHSGLGRTLEANLSECRQMLFDARFLKHYWSWGCIAHLHCWKHCCGRSSACSPCLQGSRVGSLAGNGARERTNSIQLRLAVEGLLGLVDNCFQTVGSREIEVLLCQYKEVSKKSWTPFLPHLYMCHRTVCPSLFLYVQWHLWSKILWHGHSLEALAFHRMSSSAVWPCPLSLFLGEMGQFSCVGI